MFYLYIFINLFGVLTKFSNVGINIVHLLGTFFFN